MTSRAGIIALTIMSAIFLAGAGIAWAISSETPEGSTVHEPGYVGDAAASEGIPAEIGVVAESTDYASALDEAAAIRAAEGHAPSNVIDGALADASRVSARLVRYTSTHEPSGVSDEGKPLRELPCWMVVFHGVMMHGHGGGYVDEAMRDDEPEAYPADLVVFLDADSGEYVRMMAYPSAASTH